MGVFPVLTADGRNAVENVKYNHRFLRIFTKIALKMQKFVKIRKIS